MSSSDTASRFSEAVDAGDFRTSEEVLDECFSSGTVDLVVREIRSREKQRPDLACREHVFEYCRLLPVFLELNIPSYDLLHMLRGATNREDVQSDAFELVMTLAEMRDPSLLVTEIQVEVIRESDYAVLLPWILSTRTEEMSLVRIPFSTSKEGVKRYCISDLLDTYYGRRIVWASREMKPWKYEEDSIVVGEGAFKKIESGLQTLDLEIPGLLQSVPEDEWPFHVSAIVTRRRRGQRQPPELATIHSLLNSRGYASLGRDSVLLKEIIKSSLELKTRVFSQEIIDVALSEGSDVRIEAVNALGALGGDRARDALTGLLGTSTPEVKKAAAVSLSRLESRLAWGVRPIQASVHSHIDKDRLAANLGRVAKELARLEGSGQEELTRTTIEALANVPSETSAYILKGLMRHPNAKIRKSVVQVTRVLSRETASDIIRAALQDDDPDVVGRATSIMENRWSDEVWLSDEQYEKTGDDEADSNAVED